MASEAVWPTSNSWKLEAAEGIKPGYGWPPKDDWKWEGHKGDPGMSPIPCVAMKGTWIAFSLSDFDRFLLSGRVGDKKEAISMIQNGTILVLDQDVNAWFDYQLKMNMKMSGAAIPVHLEPAMTRIVFTEMRFLRFPEKR